MPGTQVESPDAAGPAHPQPSAAKAHWRAWLLDGLSERTARHPVRTPPRTTGTKATTGGGSCA
jgi:hypothetical protein